MTKSPTTKPAQQQGDTDRNGGQMSGTTPAAPQQGQTPVIRDWASI